MDVPELGEHFQDVASDSRSFLVLQQVLKTMGTERWEGENKKPCKAGSGCALGIPKYKPRRPQRSPAYMPCWPRCR